MKLSKIRFCAFAGLAGLILTGFYAHAEATMGIKTKVIIYPVAGETIDQLHQQGITNVVNYGSYWLAQTDDKHFKALQANYGDRAIRGNYLNHIELRGVQIDTSAGEPSVPAGMRQVETSGKHLRLIQFKGPVKPDWLDQVKATGDIRVISYVPNNAYIVWLDSKSEQKLATLAASKGPIQWIGAYLPSYKIPQNLSSLSGDESVKVSVAVVDQSQDPQAESGGFAMGTVTG